MQDLTVNQVDALLERLRTALDTQPVHGDAFTLTELCEALGGVERKRLLGVIDKLWRAGEVESVKVWRRFPTRTTQVPAYRFKKAS